MIQVLSRAHLVEERTMSAAEIQAFSNNIAWFELASFFNPYIDEQDLLALEDEFHSTRWAELVLNPYDF